MVVDPDTGMPQVEEGFYWKISKVGKHMRIDLMDGSKSAVHRFVRDIFGDRELSEFVTPKMVYDTAESMLYSYVIARESENLPGTYPPKRLDRY